MGQELQTFTLTDSQIALMQRTIAKGATPDEFALFVGMCKRTQLDPFSRQIYFIKDKSGKVMTQISVDGFRVIAERSGDYAGQDEPVFEEDVTTGKPRKCSVTVYRWHGDIRYSASVGVAYWAEYNRPGFGGYASNWDKMPHTMLAKVAECIALRKAFPNDLSGLYSAEEMDQASNSTETTATELVGTSPDLIIEDDGLDQAAPPDFLEPEAESTKAMRLAREAAQKAARAKVANQTPYAADLPVTIEPVVYEAPQAPTINDTCPDHGPLRPGTGGKLYCANKVAGKWCNAWRK